MRWKAGALVFAVFLAGAAVGGLSVRVFGDRIFSTGAAATNLPVTKTEFVRQLDQKVSLTPEQRTQILAIMDDTVSEYHKIYAPMGPQFEEARHHGRERMRGVLTPEQLPKFEEFLRQLDEQRKKAEQASK
ncbi:MAG TPA: hypothetical protein VL099_16340 [Candidatus Binatia bacterium]|nr:hypothetical protein [Candidatus Binatia bacterium]